MVPFTILRRVIPYLGLSAELIPSRADALKVNRGDEVHCWATIDPDGKECVYTFPNVGEGRNAQPLYTEQFDRVQQFPHICIKDRTVYITSGDDLKLVLFGSKEVAQRLCDSSHERSRGSELSRNLESQPKQREKGLELAKPLRVWKDSTGAFSIKARFNSVENGSAVLQKTDSTLVRVRFDRLCKEDKQYVLEQMEVQKREVEAKAERIRAEADAKQGEREVEAQAKDEKIAKLLQGTIPLDKFLTEERDLNAYDASLTLAQNQLRQRETRKPSSKNMKGKTVSCVVTIREVSDVGGVCQVDCVGDAKRRRVYVSSRLAKSLNKGSEVILKWTARLSRSAPYRVDGLGLLGEVSEVIHVSK